MTRVARLLAIASLSILLVASSSAASVRPSTVSAGVGMRPGDFGSASGAVPMFQAGWRLGTHLSLRSSIAYLHEQSPGPVTQRALPSTGYARDLLGDSGGSPADRSAWYVPLGIGLRLYLDRTPSGAGRGLFLEAAPSLSLASLPLPYGYDGRDFQTLRGVQATIGARFAAADGTRGEIGLAYWSVERATTSVDYRAFVPGIHARRSFGFDAAAIYVSFGFGD